MQVSKKELCSKIARIAGAIAFTLVIGSFAAGPAHADHRGGGHRGGGGYYHGGGGYWGGGRGYYHGGGGYWGGGRGYWGGGGGYPDYYYAPQPYYYGAGPQYDVPPPRGLHEFFGL